MLIMLVSFALFSFCLLRYFMFMFCSFARSFVRSVDIVIHAHIDMHSRISILFRACVRNFVHVYVDVFG